jgi:hypothetical protein
MLGVPGASCQGSIVLDGRASSLGRLSGLEIAGEGAFEEAPSFLGLPSTDRLEDPVPDFSRKKHSVRHGIVRPTELQQGRVESIRLIEALERGTEQVGTLILPLPHLEPPLGGPTPG